MLRVKGPGLHACGCPGLAQCQISTPESKCIDCTNLGFLHKRASTETGFGATPAAGTQAVTRTAILEHFLNCRTLHTRSIASLTDSSGRSQQTCSCTRSAGSSLHSPSGAVCVLGGRAAHLHRHFLALAVMD